MKAAVPDAVELDVLLGDGHQLEPLLGALAPGAAPTCRGSPR